MPSCLSMKEVTWTLVLTSHEGTEVQWYLGGVARSLANDDITNADVSWSFKVPCDSFRARNGDEFAVPSDPWARCHWPRQFVWFTSNVVPIEMWRHMD